MVCKLSIRNQGDYISVEYTSKTGDTNLIFKTQGPSPLRVKGYGSIIHRMNTAKIDLAKFMGLYYELAVIKGEKEGADYVVVQKGLENDIVKSKKGIELISTLTLLLELRE